MNARTYHVVHVNNRRIEQHITQIKLPESLYYIAT